MISKRNFFSILIIFLATLLLFQGTQAGKEFWNDYNVNSHAGDAALKSTSAWQTPEVTDVSFDTPTPLRREGVLYVGDADSASAKAAAEWAEYAKRAFLRVDKLSKEPPAQLPCLIIVQRKKIIKNITAINNWCEAGATVLCLGMPSLEKMKEKPILRQTLGVTEIYQEKVQLDGVHLFSGFFLGGERIYQALTPEEQKKQDLELEVPWYIVRAGTKMYMQGILSEEDQKAMEEKKLKNEDAPALIWRNARGNGAVYAVNGDYGENTEIAMGLFAAVLSQERKVFLYPVVNAQVVSALNFPVYSDENRERVHEVYGRDQTDLESAIILPAMISLSTRYGFKPTMFMTPQLDYEDENEPDPKALHSFLRQINEIGSEAALGLQSRGAATLQEKLGKDEEFYREAGMDYGFSAVSTLGTDIKGIGSLPESSLLSGIKTVLMGRTEDRPLFGYLSEDVTLQQVTSIAEAHTYLEDLEMLSLETAVGYSSACFDMERSLWPETEEDEWQNFSKRVFSNLATYGAAFAEHGSVTVSESDQRIRRFLALDYEEQVEGDKLRVKLESYDKEAWFLLRCFQEKITDVTGGEAWETETGSWLVRADGEEIVITLEPTDVMFYR